MPFYAHDNRALVQVQTSENIPALIYRARQKTGHPSNSAYIREVLCRALANDLGVSYEELIQRQPNPLYIVRTDEVR
jgi:hypothetical protein